MASLHRRLLAAPLILLALALPVTTASPLGADTHVVTSDRPGGFDYVVEEVVVDVGGTLWLTNADLRAHDVVAVADGPSDASWCGRYANRGCPLFASRLLGLAEQGEVEGTDQLTPLQSYEFYCSIHPWMTGTLTAI